MVVPPPPSRDVKLGWILRLENQRTLRDLTLPDPQAPVPSPGPQMSPMAAAVSPAPVDALSAALNPDLSELVRDPDAGLRRRSALAIGRIKDTSGVPWLVSALGDADAEIRATAAFGLGLIGDARAVAPLAAALADVSPTVRGRVLDAMGRIGDKSAVPAILREASGCAGRFSPIDPDTEPVTGREEIELCRLALFALVRLQSYDGVASMVLDTNGRPVSRWWPVAFALQRINDPRAGPALRQLAEVPSVYTAGFALRGLAALKDRGALTVARRLASSGSSDVKARIAAVRYLGQVGDDGDVRTLLAMLAENSTNSPLALEAVAALGTLGRRDAFDALVDLFGDSDPAVRAAALAAAARVDGERFLVVLSGLASDPDWSVRSALATMLSTFPSERVRPALIDLARDSEARVQSAALQALFEIKAADLQEHLIMALASDDFVVRGTAARLIGKTKPEGGVARLVAAYARGQSDAAYGARAAALEALAAYGGADATRTIESALADREWPVRAQAATLLSGLGLIRAAVKPAPSRHPASFFESAALLRPAYSPHAFIETRHGVVEVQLDVVDAPIASATFVELARSGFFDGIKAHRIVPTFVLQAGDPRGDGEGGPGFTLRDELSATPYVRGTMGMALDWADTGGSQWFITLSPQPHLDGRYTAFGRVVNGWDVLDRVTSWDVIERIRIWDGIELR